MIKLYTEVSKKILQELVYINYLISEIPLFQTLFYNKIGGKKTMERYTKFSLENNCIFLPIAITRKLSLSEKFHLRNPKNVYKFPGVFEEFIKTIYIENADLTSLDKEFKEKFLNGYHKTDRYIIFNKSERLRHYIDIVNGIGSPYIEYKSSDLFLQTLEKEINKIAKDSKSKALNILSFWYSTGTTAIQSKGVKNAK